MCKYLFVQILFALLALLHLGACDSYHKTFEPEAVDVSEFSCGSDAGVTIEGEIRYEGDIPDRARLWVFFSDPEGGIPPCSMEIVGFTLPAAFRFSNVGGNVGDLNALLDLDGGFPPLPAEGDPTASVPVSELDFDSGTSGLELILSPDTEAPESDGDAEAEAESLSDGDDDASVTESLHLSCSGDSGIDVPGMVWFDGDIPPEARMYLFWAMEPEASWLCYGESSQVGFPIRFTFSDAPVNKDTGLAAFLDVDGGAWHIPETGDYLDWLSPEEVAASLEAGELHFALNPYSLPIPTEDGDVDQDDSDDMID